MSDFQILSAHIPVGGDLKYKLPVAYLKFEPLLSDFGLTGGLSLVTFVMFNKIVPSLISSAWAARPKHAKANSYRWRAVWSPAKASKTSRSLYT